MDPAVWGPTTWRLVLTASFRLPRDRCLAMFDSLRYILPCVHCRRSYRAYLQQLPPKMAIREKDDRSAARFAWTIKDHVNGKLGTGHTLPFSVLCERHEVFSSPVSRMDVADLLCCMAMQVEDGSQVEALETFAGVLRDLLASCGEPALPHLQLPLAEAHRSPATLWLHFMKVRNGLCTEVGAPCLNREAMIARYRREAKPEPTPRKADAKAASSSSAPSTPRRSTPRTTSTSSLRRTRHR